MQTFKNESEECYSYESSNACCIIEIRRKSKNLIVTPRTMHHISKHMYLSTFFIFTPICFFYSVIVYATLVLQCALLLKVVNKVTIKVN